MRGGKHECCFHGAKLHTIPVRTKFLQPCIYSHIPKPKTNRSLRLSVPQRAIYM